MKSARLRGLMTGTCGKPLPAETVLHVRRRLLEEGHHDIAAALLLSLIGELPLWRPRAQDCEAPHGA